MLIFYRGAYTFRSIFSILTPPPILETSAPFAISGIFIAIVHPFDLFMTHTKSQLPARRNHLIMVSQSQIKLKADQPCTGVQNVSSNIIS
jgi:hypothetical protein